MPPPPETRIDPVQVLTEGFQKFLALAAVLIVLGAVLWFFRRRKLDRQRQERERILAEKRGPGWLEERKARRAQQDEASGDR